MFLFFSCFALFCFTSVQMFVGVTGFRCGQGLLQCRVENSRRAAPVWRGSVGLVVALAFLLYPLTALLLPHPPYLPAPLVTSPQASFPISPSPLVGFQWLSAAKKSEVDGKGVAMPKCCKIDYLSKICYSFLEMCFVFLQCFQPEDWCGQH